MDKKETITYGYVLLSKVFFIFLKPNIKNSSNRTSSKVKGPTIRNCHPNMQTVKKSGNAFRVPLKTIYARKHIPMSIFIIIWQFPQMLNVKNRK